MHILHVVGARPNFMKAAPVIRALTDGTHHRQTLVHTGQHYDANMSEVFFHQLGLADPDINLLGPIEENSEKHDGALSPGLCLEPKKGRFWYAAPEHL